MIFRRVKDKNYTVIPNEYLQDDNLKDSAKLLLTQILTLPNDWKINVRGLCKVFGGSADKIASALNNLIEAGYISREQSNSAKGFGRIDYAVYDYPAFLEENPCTGNPYTEKQYTEDPCTGKQYTEQEEVNVGKSTEDTTKTSGSPCTVFPPLINTNNNLNTKNSKPASSGLINLSRSSKTNAWVTRKVHILEGYKFSRAIHGKLLQFLKMLVETNSLLADDSIIAQFDKLQKLSDDNKLTAVTKTITRGWKSLDYAIDELLKSTTASFDKQKKAIRHQMNQTTETF